MNRADSFFERDATGWQFIDVWSGRTSINFRLPNNSSRTVAYNTVRKEPEDTKYQSKRIPPQNHF
jgi:3',5'-cyclic-AMP phosphodiesterase